MASRMTWFIFITIYLIFANIIIVSIVSSININVTYDNDDITSINDTTTQKGLKNNAITLFNLMTFQYDGITGLLYFIFVTLPLIFWFIILATFLLPTTNAGS